MYVVFHENTKRGHRTHLHYRTTTRRTATVRPIPRLCEAHTVDVRTAVQRGRAHQLIPPHGDAKRQASAENSLVSAEAPHPTKRRMLLCICLCVVGVFACIALSPRLALASSFGTRRKTGEVCTSGAGKFEALDPCACESCSSQHVLGNKEVLLPLPAPNVSPLDLTLASSSFSRTATAVVRFMKRICPRKDNIVHREDRGTHPPLSTSTKVWSQNPTHLFASRSNAPDKIAPVTQVGQPGPVRRRLTFLNRTLSIVQDRSFISNRQGRRREREQNAISPLPISRPKHFVASQRDLCRRTIARTKTTRLIGMQSTRYALKTT